ncbi:MAG: amidase [Streptosporangiales bacterium]|nr:amidase [Streptosporangiales bacterium]
MASNELTLTEIARRIDAGELRPTELLDDCLARIAEREPDVHAWEYLDDGPAKQQAAACDGAPPTGPLHGVPLAVKDIIDVAGLPTRCGTPVRADRVATADAWCVQRLRDAGAVVLGKTVTTEFAYFSPGKTHNPHVHGHTPGGSSSGSAAAVAAGMAPCAFGTQTAGSVIRPASFCGVAGFVPTFGRIPLTGVQHLAPELDRLGFFAPAAADLHLLYRALVDGVGPLQARPPARVLLTDGSALADVHPAMRDALRRVADVLTEQGVPVEPLDEHELERRCVTAQQLVMAYDAAQTLAGEVAEHRAQLSDALLELVERGAAMPEADYRGALEVAAAARDELDGRLVHDTVVLAPAAPGPAPAGLASTGDPIMNRPWHLLGMPEATLPAGTVDGLPLGVQLVAAHGADETLLATVAWLGEQLGS